MSVSDIEVTLLTVVDSAAATPPPFSASGVLALLAHLSSKNVGEKG
jgi:hypothetical protein